MNWRRDDFEGFMIDPFFRELVWPDTNAARWHAATCAHSRMIRLPISIITADSDGVGKSLALASKSVHRETEGERTTPECANE